MIRPTITLLTLNTIILVFCSRCLDACLQEILTLQEKYLGFCPKPKFEYQTQTLSFIDTPYIHSTLADYTLQTMEPTLFQLFIALAYVTSITQVPLTTCVALQLTFNLIRLLLWRKSSIQVTLQNIVKEDQAINTKIDAIREDLKWVQQEKEKITKINSQENDRGLSGMIDHDLVDKLKKCSKRRADFITRVIELPKEIVLPSLQQPSLQQPSLQLPAAEEPNVYYEVKTPYYQTQLKPKILHTFEQFDRVNDNPCSQYPSPRSQLSFVVPQRLNFKNEKSQICQGSQYYSNERPSRFCSLTPTNYRDY